MLSFLPVDNRIIVVRIQEQTLSFIYPRGLTCISASLSVFWTFSESMRADLTSLSYSLISCTRFDSPWSLLATLAATSCLALAYDRRSVSANRSIENGDYGSGIYPITCGFRLFLLCKTVQRAEQVAK